MELAAKFAGVCIALRCTGEATKDVPVSISADAVAKATHFQRVARSSRHLEPYFKTHFGHSNSMVQRFVTETAGKKKMDLAAVKAHGPSGPPASAAAVAAAGVGEGVATSSAAAVAAAAGEGDPDAEACTSHLHCARPSAVASGGLDVFGIVGAVCAHVSPVRGSFMDLLTHEAYGYYIIMFSNVLPLLNRVRDVYVDFGCRLEKTWKAYYEMHKAKPELCATSYRHLGAVRILVNWMHGAGHVLACQLAHSGRFTDEAARRIGEMTEQLWAMLKVRSLCVM